VGQDQPLPFINTHYHHRTADSAIRVGQTEVILDFLAGYEGDHFIITGDLNAEPDTPEIRAFLAAGAVDVVLEAGLKPDHTYPAEVPDQRLDYILIHPPLASTEVVIPPSTASDHLGIAATISLEER
jgi:endonuclease/exonuclease/phosphatase family metal-dependent hydrolase